MSSSLPFSLSFSALRRDFEKWLRNRGLSERYIKDKISYLDRFVDTITSVDDIIEILNKSSSKMHMAKSLRLFIKYCVERSIITNPAAERLLSVIKVPRGGIDMYVPSTSRIISCYKTINNEKIKILFKLLSFSGIRLVEAVRLLNDFEDSKIIFVNDKTARYALSLRRKTKNVYYAYLPSSFASELRKIKISYSYAEKAIKKSGVAAKYLRKWNYNFLIENGVPEAVTDFIQGRAPVSAGSMHYLAKVQQADRFYTSVVDKLLSLFS